QPVFRVDVVDTVGAGDAFLAAFTTSHLRDNPIQDSLRYGCAVGALTAAKAGGTPQISTAEIDAILTSVNRHN
ncbi:MAG: carbohydrate kinase family protein, partial [Bacteroidota bacterium]